ncbi:MAG: hypothetical protein AB9888_12650 [Bacteroidales bacterium]
MIGTDTIFKAGAKKYKIGVLISNSGTLGWVYDCFEIDSEEKSIGGDTWIVKVGRVTEIDRLVPVSLNKRLESLRKAFKEEADLINRIRTQTKSRWVLPVVSASIEETSDGASFQLPTLVMPKADILLSKATRNGQGKINEELFLKTGTAYARLLSVLHEMKISIPDRKLDDFRLKDEDLVVLDWNLYTDCGPLSEQEFQMKIIGDYRNLVKFWFEIATGRQVRESDLRIDGDVMAGLSQGTRRLLCRTYFLFTENGFSTEKDLKSGWSEWQDRVCAETAALIQMYMTEKTAFRDDNRFKTIEIVSDWVDLLGRRGEDVADSQKWLEEQRQSLEKEQAEQFQKINTYISDTNYSMARVILLDAFQGHNLAPENRLRALRCRLAIEFLERISSGPDRVPVNASLIRVLDALAEVQLNDVILTGLWENSLSAYKNEGPLRNFYLEWQIRKKYRELSVHSLKQLEQLENVQTAFRELVPEYARLMKLVYQIDVDAKIWQLEEEKRHIDAARSCKEREASLVKETLRLMDEQQFSTFALQHLGQNWNLDESSILYSRLERLSNVLEDSISVLLDYAVHPQTNGFQELGFQDLDERVKKLLSTKVLAILEDKRTQKPYYPSAVTEAIHLIERASKIPLLQPTEAESLKEYFTEIQELQKQARDLDYDDLENADIDKLLKTLEDRQIEPFDAYKRRDQRGVVRYYQSQRENSRASKTAKELTQRLKTISEELKRAKEELDAGPLSNKNDNVSILQSIETREEILRELEAKISEFSQLQQTVADLLNNETMSPAHLDTLIQKREQICQKITVLNDPLQPNDLLRQQIDELETQIKALEDRIANLQNMVTNTNQEIKNLNKEGDETQSRFAKLVREQMEEYLSNLDRQIHEVSKEVNQLEAQFDQQKIEVDQQIITVNGKISSLEQNLESKRDALQKSIEQITESKKITLQMQWKLLLKELREPSLMDQPLGSSALLFLMAETEVLFSKFPNSINEDIFSIMKNVRGTLREYCCDKKVQVTIQRYYAKLYLQLDFAIRRMKLAKTKVESA